METFKTVDRRLQFYKSSTGACLLDDGYNANPASVLAAIKVLSRYPREKVLILGDMLELGMQAEEYHRQVGLQAKDFGIDALYCYGELTKHSYESFSGKGGYFSEQDALVSKIKPELNSETTVLVKGSLGMGMIEIIKQLI